MQNVVIIFHLHIFYKFTNFTKKFIMQKFSIVTKILLLVNSFLLMNCQSLSQQNNANAMSDKKFEINKSDQEWKQQLSPADYHVLREKGTEQPYTGSLLYNKEKGIYCCKACGSELFSSDMKFDSQCGWPSFDNEIAGGKIIKQADTSFGMIRTEIICAKCGSHLGHLFDDGPTSTGLRYCTNSASLKFEKAEDNSKSDTAVLAGGCFWCLEGIYNRVKGVISVESGYAGGTIENPSYNEVCEGYTGHAECVKIVFNPEIISFEDLLIIFFSIHDPTSLNRQGADIGTQYRSAIFYTNNAQKSIAEKVIKKMVEEKIFAEPIVTTLESHKIFYKAEKYHQGYYDLNKNQPYCRMVIQPKLEKFLKNFKEKAK